MSNCSKLVMISFLFLVSCANNGQADEQPELTTPLKNSIETRQLRDSPNTKYPVEQTVENEPQSPDVGANKKSPPEELYGAHQKDFNQVDVETEKSFHEFQKQWNKLSDSLASNLYIIKFETIQHENGISYSSLFDEKMELRVLVSSNYVQTIGLISKPQADEKMMLAGWKQIILMVLPEFDLVDADDLLKELGVKSNGDMTNLRLGTITLDRVNIEVTKDTDGTVFRALFK